MTEGQRDVAADFKYYPADDTTGKLHQHAREVCSDAAQQLLEIVPIGREQSLMLTKLEEAMFWANAGIARKTVRL